MPFKEIADAFSIPNELVNLEYDELEIGDVLNTLEVSYFLLGRVYGTAKELWKSGEFLGDKEDFRSRFITAALSRFFCSAVSYMKDVENVGTVWTSMTLEHMNEWCLRAVESELAAWYREDNDGYIFALNIFDGLVNRIMQGNKEGFDEALEAAVPLTEVQIHRFGDEMLMEVVSREELLVMALEMVHWVDPGMPALLIKDGDDDNLDIHILMTSPSPQAQIIDVLKSLRNLDWEEEEERKYFRGASHLINSRLQKMILKILAREFGYVETEIDYFPKLNPEDILRGKLPKEVLEIYLPYVVITTAYSNIIFSDEATRNYLVSGKPPEVGVIRFPSNKMRERSKRRK